MIGVRIKARARWQLDTRVQQQPPMRCIPPPGVNIMLTRTHAATQVTVCAVHGVARTGQSSVSHFIDAALELHHHIQRNPIVIPTPGVELPGGWHAGSSPNRAPAIAADTRFVSGPMSARVAADVPVRHLIAQPTRCGQPRERGWMQAHFFVEFPEHRLFGRFARSLCRLAGTASWGVCACPRTPGFSG